MTSQNATFIGSVDPDPEYDHPAGLPILRALLAHLSTRDWTAGDFDNWRDSGWNVICRRAEAELELIVAATDAPGEWMVQIAPVRAPGLIGRALGRVASAGPARCHALAMDVHAVLSERFGRLRWRRDGFPDEANSTPAPTPPT